MKKLFYLLFALFMICCPFGICHAAGSGSVHFQGKVEGTSKFTLEIQLRDANEMIETYKLTEKNKLENGLYDITIPVSAGNYSIEQLRFSGCDTTNYTVSVQNIAVVENQTINVEFSAVYDETTENAANETSVNGGRSGAEQAREAEKKEDALIASEPETSEDEAEAKATATPNTKTTGSKITNFFSLILENSWGVILLFVLGCIAFFVYYKFFYDGKDPD